MYQRLELGGLVVFESQCTGCGIPDLLIRWQTTKRRCLCVVFPNHQYPQFLSVLQHEGHLGCVNYPQKVLLGDLDQPRVTQEKLVGKTG